MGSEADHGPNLAAWAAAAEEHARVLRSALADLHVGHRRLWERWSISRDGTLQDALTLLAESRLTPVAGPTRLDDTQGFLIELPPQTEREAVGLTIRLVVTFEGWLLWDRRGSPPATLAPIAEDLAVVLSRSAARIRPAGWILSSWGLTRARPGRAFERLKDEAALLEARFHLAGFARIIDVSVPGVA